MQPLVDSLYDPRGNALCLVQVGQVRDLQQMMHNVEQQQEVVVDARGAPRFQAKAPEPRPGMRGGHIPHSKNVPFDAVLSDGRCSHHIHAWS